MSASQLRLHMRVGASCGQRPVLFKAPNGPGCSHGWEEPPVSSWLRAQLLILFRQVLYLSKVELTVFPSAWAWGLLHCGLNSTLPTLCAAVTVRRDERARWWESQRVSRTSGFHREAISESSHCNWAAEEVLLLVGVTDDVWAAWRFCLTCVFAGQAEFGCLCQVTTC